MRCLVTLLMSTGLLAQSVTLTDLPQLARNRAERLRPQQEKALEPFWEDLSLNFLRNRTFVTTRVQLVAALGDTVVPLLLEKLDPEDDSPDALNLAGNSARVLALLDPASFTEALVELVEGDSAVARSHAIALLGHTQSERAGPVLGRLLSEFQTDEDRVAAIHALSELGNRQAAEQVVSFLPGSRSVRQAVLDYLNATSPDSVVDAVLSALTAERDGTLLRGYIGYLGKAVHADGAVAEAVLPLLSDPRMVPGDQIALCQALAAIAPSGHQGTTQKLRQILEGGQMGDLGRAAAVTLFKLGDRAGTDILYAKLQQNARRNRDEASWLERAELLFALEMWQESAADYRSAVRVADRRETRTFCQLRIARCEAHRGRWKNVLTALKDSAAGREAIMREAAEDQALNSALDEDSIRRWFDSLPGR